MVRVLGIVMVCLVLTSCRGSGDSESTLVTLEPEWVPPTTSRLPHSAIRIEPGESIQTAADAAGPGATLVLGEGIHRLQQVDPHNDQVFIGEPGAIISGAIKLENFHRQGDVWVHGGIDLAGEERGRCRSSEPACSLPEDLFVDGVLVRRVLSAEEVDSGTWFLDPATETLTLGQDPTGKLVEVSALEYAFGGTAESVTIQNLIIEKYAAPGQRGAVMSRKDWAIIACEVRFTHGAGVRTAAGVTVRDSYLHHNGQFGLAGGGVGVTVDGNEISHNGTVGYSPGWAAGGSKFIQVTRLNLVDNYVHSNRGPGLWTDAGLENTTYERNRVWNNEHAGIKHEISGSARILSNEVVGNGFGHSSNLRGPGILIRESGPAVVTGNVIWGNRDAIVLLQDDGRNNDTGYELRDIEVTGNDVAFDGGRLAVIGDVSDLTTAGLQIDGNRYFDESEELEFVLMDRSMGWSEWRNATGDTSVILDREELPS